jgi:hypothetical protein
MQVVDVMPLGRHPEAERQANAKDLPATLRVGERYSVD